MPVVCTECGAGLADEAAFCWRCGYVRRSTTTVAAGVTTYETCEVVYGKSGKTGKMVFQARALGDHGTYLVAESDPLKYDSMTYLSGNSHATLDRLVAVLVAQGWEPLGVYGIYYWDHRLRRRLPAEAVEEARAGVLSVERALVAGSLA